MGAKVTYNSAQEVKVCDIWDEHFEIVCTNINQPFIVIQMLKHDKISMR